MKLKKPGTQRGAVAICGTALLILAAAYVGSAKEDDGETRSDAEIARQRAEEVARKAADIEWLREGLEYAASVKAKGVMVIWQAHSNFNNEQYLSDTRSWDGFPDYVNALQSDAIAFPGQVALVHGDSHYFKMDKPINRPSGGASPRQTSRPTHRHADRQRQSRLVWAPHVAASADPTSKYLNNVVEQDHRRVKQRIGPMLGFKRSDTATITISGVELAEKIKKSQFKIGQLAVRSATAPAIWAAVLVS